MIDIAGEESREDDETLRVHFEAGDFAEDRSGSVDVVFRTPRARAILGHVRRAEREVRETARANR